MLGLGHFRTQADACILGTEAKVELLELRSPCRGNSEECVKLRMTTVASSGLLGEEELNPSAHLPQINAEMLLYLSYHSFTKLCVL